MLPAMLSLTIVAVSGSCNLFSLADLLALSYA
jgi:hypothetical protein